MKLNYWLSEYSKSHQNKTNERIHRICVPLITFSLLGLLWSLPIPDFFSYLAYLNFATLFCAICLIFYVILGIRVAFFMSIPIIFMLWIISIMAKESYFLPVIGTIFILSWVFQLWGHRVEGSRPSFTKNLIFFLIGPIWLLRSLNLV